MKWTKDRPTKPGWYWVKWPAFWDILRYEWRGIDEPGMLWAYSTKCAEPISEDGIEAWYGPLDVPPGTPADPEGGSR